VRMLLCDLDFVERFLVKGEGMSVDFSGRAGGQTVPGLVSLPRAVAGSVSHPSRGCKNIKKHTISATYNYYTQFIMRPSRAKSVDQRKIGAQGLII